MNVGLLYLITGAGLINLILMFIRGGKTSDNMLIFSGVVNTVMMATALLYAVRPDLYDMNVFHLAMATVFGVAAMKESVYLISHKYQIMINADKLSKALQSLQDKYALVFENSLVGFYVIDEDGKIELVNNKFCTIFGYEKRELIGKSIFSLIAPDSLNYIHEQAELKFSGQLESSCYEANVVTKTNEIIRIKIYSSRTRNGHLTITGTILPIVDIEEC